MLTVVLRMMGALPLRWLHAIGARLGVLAPYLSRGYRDRFDNGFKNSGCADPALRRAALREAGKTMLELPWVWTQPTEATQARVMIADWSPVERAAARGRGILFLTPHQGCFEITAQTYAHRQGPITVLFTPPRIASVRRMMHAARTRTNLDAASASIGGVRQLVRALKRGEAIGILPDQVPGPNEGAWAEFLGRPAYTMTLPARLQRMSGAAVIIAFGERLPDSAGYRLHLFEWNEPWADTPEGQARQVNIAIERVIRRWPAQYLWAYNRYKRPYGVPPPPPSASGELS